MLNRLLRFILGYVTFSFQKGFCNDFLNDCFKSGVALRNVRMNGETLFADCTASEYKKLHKIAYSHGGVVKIEKRRGIMLALSRYSSRVGLAVGGLICIILFCLLSGFVWNIEIVGTESLTKSEISNFLEQNGFFEGVFWRSVDKGVLEDLMMASFDEIAWVHINRFGTSARVEIEESTAKPKIINSTGCANLKAKKDGVIVSAVTYEGWQNVAVGESVRAGDILVSGVYESEQTKQNLFAYARGDFIACVEEKVDYTVLRKEKRKAYYRDLTLRSIYFFGLNIPLYVGRLPKQNADISRRSSLVKINEQSVPVGIITYDVCLYNTEEYSLTDSELNEKIKTSLEQMLDDEYGADNILSRDISISLESDSARAVGSIKVLENIGEEVIIQKE